LENVSDIPNAVCKLSIPPKTELQLKTETTQRIVKGWAGKENQASLYPIHDLTFAIRLDHGSCEPWFG
jgi:hypothetical protein